MAGSPGHAESVYDSVPLPLGKTMCIRVIKIRPITTSDLSDLIVCDFSILDVDNGALIYDEETSHQSSHRTSEPLEASERVEYQAVSYTWGDPPANHIIELNGTSFSVRRNLWAFLRQARANGVTGFLWIDAICIDQTTIGERNHQVGMMGAIYSQAKCVIVWLGEGSDEHRSYLAKMFDDCIKHGRSKDYEMKNDNFEMVKEFLYMPYWRRAWIVQEYYLASRKDIWYGELRVDQRRLKIMQFVLYDDILFHITPAASLWRTQERLHSEDTGRIGGGFQKFLTLMHLMLHLQCADLRDRVFAILPLLTCEERKELGINPDYSKTPTDLFLDVATRLRKGVDEKSYLNYFEDLERVLEPDLGNRVGQLIFLDLRAMYRPFHRVKELDHVDHQCERQSQSPPDIGIEGCSYCHRKPVLRFYDWKIRYPWDPNPMCFSKKEWQTYVQSLLTSDDEGDKDLGYRYGRDYMLGPALSDESHDLMESSVSSQPGVDRPKKARARKRRELINFVSNCPKVLHLKK